MQSKELDSITWKLMPPTRALQTAFTAWARGEASESEVSDQYVRLGNEFIAARSRLAAGGLAVDDLVDVPTQLRGILEDALALDYSPAVAEQYDPQIRAVMSHLFHQLKAKQLQLSTNQSSTHASQEPAPSQHTRHNSQGQLRGPPAPQSQWPSNQQIPPNQQGLPSQPVPPNQQAPQSQGASQNQGAPQSQAQGPQGSQGGSSGAQGPQTHTKHSSQSRRPVHASYGSHNRAQAQAPAQEAQRSMHYPRQRPMTSNGPAHAPSSSFGAGGSGPGYTNGPGAHRGPEQAPQWAPQSAPSTLSVPSESHPPAIPAPKRPESVDQEDDALSLLQRHGALERQASKRYSTRQISRMMNGTAEQMNLPTSGIHKTLTPEFKESNVIKEASERSVSERVSERASDRVPDRIPDHSLRRSSRRSSGARSPLLASPRSTVGSPTKQVDELSVFLRLGNDIRKAKLLKPVSIAAIRLRFVEVCAYIHSGDDTFPPITIQDPQSGINYEVTEATVGDVGDGSLLTLKVKTEEELGIEEKLNKLTESIAELSSKIQSSNGTPAASGGPGSGGLARGNSTKTFSSPAPSKFASPVLTGEGRFKLERPPAPPRELPVDKVETVHREIAVIRQLSSKTIAALKAEVEKLRSEVKELGTAGGHETMSDRRTMNKIKQQMEDSSQNLLSQMESLSDVIDAQRVGIGSHGVRYPQNELEKVRKQLAAWSEEFEKSEQFIQNEKPVWKKTWQTELNNVIEDQEWLKNLDMLYGDLRTDLEQSFKTFELVCEANSLPRKPTSRQGMPMAPPIKPGEEKNVVDAVFHEITALNLNSEQRAEAVQRAERLHKAKLALRSEEFEDELNTFVSDSKLKQNGGFEEVERRMREREQSARKLGEESEREARKHNEKLREERRAKRRGEPVEAQAKEASSKEAPTQLTNGQLPVQTPGQGPGEVTGQPHAQMSAQPADQATSQSAAAVQAPTRQRPAIQSRPEEQEPAPNSARALEPLEGNSGTPSDPA